MRIFLAALMLISASASASEKFMPDPENQMQAPGVISARVPWIKDKDGKFDVNLVIHNEDNDKGMIVFLTDMGCKRGSVRGQLRHTFFNTGEKTIDFKPNETKEFTLVCKIEGKVNGDFKLEIAKVYSNPSLDGKTVGKVVAKDLKWSQKVVR